MRKTGILFLTLLILFALCAVCYADDTFLTDPADFYEISKTTNFDMLPEEVLAKFSAYEDYDCVQYEIETKNEEQVECVYIDAKNSISYMYNFSFIKDNDRKMSDYSVTLLFVDDSSPYVTFDSLAEKIKTDYPAMKEFEDDYSDHLFLYQDKTLSLADDEKEIVLIASETNEISMAHIMLAYKKLAEK